MKLKSILLCASALLMVGNSFAQSMVTTAGKKYVLLEEGTGTWCGYCPDGAEDIERNIEPNYPKAVIASFHNGDGLALSPDTYNADFISTYGQGWPGATIDRNSFTDLLVPSFTGMGLNRPWEPYIAMDSLLAPKFDVTMKSYYDAVHDTIVVNFTAKCLVAGTGTWHVNVYITEDSISSASYAQDNYARPACASSCNHYMNTQNPPYDVSWFWLLGDPIAPSTKYSHMNVVRAILGTDLYGDAVPTFVNPVVGATYTKTYKYHLPASSNMTYTKVIGLVQKFGSAKTDRAIENTIEARVRLMSTASTVLGESNITNTLEGFTVAPNPAKNTITVKGSFNSLVPTSTTITIVNSIGQVVFNSTYPAGGSMFGEVISVKDFNDGIYFMNISNSGSSTTRQFVVNK